MKILNKSEVFNWVQRKRNAPQTEFVGYAISALSTTVHWKLLQTSSSFVVFYLSTSLTTNQCYLRRFRVQLPSRASQDIFWSSLKKKKQEVNNISALGICIDESFTTAAHFTCIVVIPINHDMQRASLKM